MLSSSMMSLGTIVPVAPGSTGMRIAFWLVG
jgi:hypothetical protein